MGRTRRRVTGAAALLRAVRDIRRPNAPSIADRAAAVPRMAKAALSGEYDGVSPARLALMAAAAGYVISPVDLVPEAVLSVFGMADDVAVTAWLTGTMLAETEKFLEWESSRPVQAARLDADAEPWTVTRADRPGGTG